MQVRTVVVRMPGRVEVVVTPGESRVQGALGPGLLPVELRIIMTVPAVIDLSATAKHLEAVDETVLAAGEITIEGRQNGLVKPNTCRCSAPPLMGRPWCLTTPVTIANSEGDGCDGKHSNQHDSLHATRRPHPRLFLAPGDSRHMVAISAPIGPML